MQIEVVPADSTWSRQFEQVAATLAEALNEANIEAAIEHVGSTSVPGLAAKPILDIDIIVGAGDIKQAIARLEAADYHHRGDLGVIGREAFAAPDELPRRHVYLSTPDNLHVRNHLAVRDVLRKRPFIRHPETQLSVSEAGCTTRATTGVEVQSPSETDSVQKTCACDRCHNLRIPPEGIVWCDYARRFGASKP